jgi:hypothetical protein
MKQKYYLILGIIALVIIAGIIFIGNIQQPEVKEVKLPTGEVLKVEAYEGFNLSVDETKEFSLSEHKISVTYLENLPQNKLEITIDNGMEIIVIGSDERNTCSDCYTCYEFDVGVSCKIEPETCWWVNSKCQDVAKEKKTETEYTCEIKDRVGSDCMYRWSKEEIVFIIQPPLTVEQDLDNDGKICEDPFEINGEPVCGAGFQEGLQIDNDGDGLINEDYQEYYYYRKWDTDVLEFSALIPTTCPPGVGCPE